MLAFFHEVGTLPVVNDLLISSHNDKLVESAVSFNSLLEMPSAP